MSHPKPVVLLIAAVLLFAASSCTTYTKVNTDKVKDFRKDIRSQYKEIRDVSVQFSPTLVEVRYTFKTTVSEDTVKEIFAETKALVQSREFQEQVIEKLYFEKYSNEDKIYPDITIDFDQDRDGVTDIRFTSHYYVHGRAARTRPVDPSTDIDGYQTWYYAASDHDMPQPVSDE